MDRSRIAIIIPALNESATITTVVAAADRYGVPIVVDDGSTDNTTKLAKQAGAVVVSHDNNQGYDAALNTGFKKASLLGSDIIITLDADGQHDPSLIQEFIDSIDDGADIVAGIRSHQQRFTEHLFAWYTNFCFGIKDPLCGMKAYRSKIYEALGHFDSYKSIGTELVIFAARNGFKISQKNIITKERKDQSRFGRKLTANFRIIRAMILSLLRTKRKNLSRQGI